jgi:hypothetical protein
LQKFVAKFRFFFVVVVVASMYVLLWPSLFLTGFSPGSVVCRVSWCGLLLRIFEKYHEFSANTIQFKCVSHTYFTRAYTDTHIPVYLHADIHVYLHNTYKHLCTCMHILSNICKYLSSKYTHICVGMCAYNVHICE